MVQKNQLKRGFTIVELLIVIIVIGILAAITIVSYSGITARANTTKSATNAAAVQRVVEAFAADCGRYPATVAEFTSSPASCFTSTRIPAGVSVVFATPTSGSPTGIWYQCLGATCSATANAGGRLQYWDYTTSTVSTTVIYLGTATSSGTFTSPAS